MMASVTRKTALPLLSLLCLTGWASRAIAHGVDIQYQATQAYEIQAAFDTGEPMSNAQVAVFSPDDPAKPWATGTTDATGRFLFTPSAPGNWEVQVRKAGHGDILVIPVQGEATPASTTQPSAENPAVIPGVIATYTPLQKGLMMGAVIWGCVGTALFFARGKKRLEGDAHS